MRQPFGLYLTPTSYDAHTSTACSDVTPWRVHCGAAPTGWYRPNRPSLISQPELVRRLGTAVDSLSKAGQFSGVAVLAKNGVPVFQRAYGMADRERGVANNLETVFNLGSINKIFTQIAILQLSAAGKLDLDSTLAAYWPDYPNKDVARKITIRQLMRHTSGIGGSIFDTPAGGRRSDVRTLKGYLALFVNELPQFKPGIRNTYSNAGYVVLGLLIERLSGDDYYRYVREHIFKPAGVTRTGSFLNERDRRGRPSRRVRSDCPREPRSTGGRTRCPDDERVARSPR